MNLGTLVVLTMLTPGHIETMRFPSPVCAGGGGRDFTADRGKHHPGCRRHRSHGQDGLAGPGSRA